MPRGKGICHAETGRSSLKQINQIMGASDRKAHLSVLDAIHGSRTAAQMRKKSGAAAMLLAVLLSVCSCTPGGGGESTAPSVTGGEPSVSADTSAPAASAEPESYGNGRIDLPIDRF